VSCSQVRRELLERFAFREELGPASGPHLAHLETCPECRQEVGIDRQLVRQLRRALEARVAGGAPSEASWELVRSRTVDRPVRPWLTRVPQWGGMATAAAAAIMMFAVATAPETRLFPGNQSPAFVVSPASRVLAPVEEANSGSPPRLVTYHAPQSDPPHAGWPMATQTTNDVATTLGDPPITGRMR
jgi:hypothetical protein